MFKKLTTLGSFLIVLILFGGCTTRGAAMLGAAIGQGIGTPIGVAAVAFDEAGHVTGEIVRANPRYASNFHQPQAAPVGAPRHPEPRRFSGATSRHHGHEQTYVYKAEVLVRTRGPAQIEAIDFVDAEEVNRFWK